MATNADDTNDDVSTAADTGKTTEDDLRNLKYDKAEVDPKANADEDESTGSDDSDDDAADGGDADGQTDDGANDDDSQEDSTEFVKEFPNIPGNTIAEYARNVEKAYGQSTGEALRLKGLIDQSESTATADQGADDGKTADTKIDITNPLELFAKQELDNKIQVAFAAFQKDYPQAVPGSAEYAAFTNEVAILSSTIMNSQRRLAPPEELYNKAAVILGWDKGSAPTDKEKLGMAVKGQAAVSKTSSSTKSVPKSRVTPDMIALNKKMYPDKSEQQIRKELEPHIK